VEFCSSGFPGLKGRDAFKAAAVSGTGSRDPGDTSLLSEFFRAELGVCADLGVEQTEVFLLCGI